MNCYCLNPLPVKQYTVNKSGDNFGRLFFSCSDKKCKFFCWFDDTMNNSIHSKYVKNQITSNNGNNNGNNSYSYGGNNNLNGNSFSNSSSNSSSSLMFGNNNLKSSNNLSSSSSSNNSSSSSSSSKGQCIVVKLMVGEFEMYLNNTIKVWFDVQCPMDHKIKLYFDLSKC